VPLAHAELELVAPVEDVWRFLAEPRHLADWWPGIAAVEPDRRGLAAGARWTARGTGQAPLLRKAHAEDVILIREVEPFRRLLWHKVKERLDAELVLEPVAHDRTRARLVVRAPLMVAFGRKLPRVALARLQSLIRTAESLE
jgi:uncharacterized protein YndB with AHSA1/START domain